MDGYQPARLGHQLNMQCEVSSVYGVALMFWHTMMACMLQSSAIRDQELKLIACEKRRSWLLHFKHDEMFRQSSRPEPWWASGTHGSSTG